MQITTTTRGLWQSLKTYLGGDRAVRQTEIPDMQRLAEFLETRANHVGQTSLFGYLRTRAGSRYSELFQNDVFVEAVNIAKWQIWLACLSDIAVFAGGILAQRSKGSSEDIGALITAATEAVLARTGTPTEAGDRFAENRDQLRARLAGIDWRSVGDDETPFSCSPEALVYWAPIVDDLKALDAEIVRNSVRFRWQEVRRDLRTGLDADGVISSFRAGPFGPTDAP